MPYLSMQHGSCSNEARENPKENIPLSKQEQLRLRQRKPRPKVPAWAFQVDTPVQEKDALLKHGYLTDTVRFICMLVLEL